MRKIDMALQLPIQLNFVERSEEDTSRPSTAERTRGGRPRNGSAAIILAASLRDALA